MRRSQHAYHFLCEGAVLPEQRGRGAGQALLICALNHARVKAFEIEPQAQEEGAPIYFEVLLPGHDPHAESLAAKCELRSADEPTLKGMRLYRGDL